MGKVLVAEDEGALADAFSDIIAGLGHEVLVANDGDEALSLAREHHPDLIVSDHMMPGRTGIELLRAIAADPALSGIRFILVSAAYPRGAEAAWRFISKPLSIEVLEQAVREGFGREPAPGAAPVGDGVETPVTTKVGVKRHEALDWLAHELRTPLSSARLNADLLTRRLQDGVDQEPPRRLGEISRQLDRMGELLDVVLDLVALSSGSLVVTLRPHDLRAFLLDLAARWREREPGLDLELDLPDGAAVLPTDGAHLRQALGQVLAAALKAAPVGKRVGLRLSTTAREALIRVSAREAIAPRAEAPATAAVTAPFGFGLELAAALVRAQGGALDVLGGGRTFVVRLPLSP